jgi:hypothetical protein
MATAAKSQLLENFLNNVVEDEVSDEYINCPEFEEATATVKGYIFNEGVSKSSDGEEEKPWLSLSLNFIINEQEARDVVGRDEVLVPAQFFLNTNAAGGLDIRGNEKLGKFLKVLNVPSAGRTAFEILEDLKGRSCLAKVRHIARKNLDENDNEIIDARVTAIAKI